MISKETRELNSESIEIIKSITFDVDFTDKIFNVMSIDYIKAVRNSYVR